MLTMLGEKTEGLPLPTGAAAYKKGPLSVYMVDGVLTAFRRVRVPAKKNKKTKEVIEEAYTEYRKEGPAAKYADIEVRACVREFYALCDGGPAIGAAGT